MSGINGETTLGEVWSRAYTNYRYRLIWPVVGWVGFLYATLWEDYSPPSEKKKQLERMEKLKALEFSG